MKPLPNFELNYQSIRVPTGSHQVFPPPSPPPPPLLGASPFLVSPPKSQAAEKLGGGYVQPKVSQETAKEAKEKGETERETITIEDPVTLIVFFFFLA